MAEHSRGEKIIDRASETAREMCFKYSGGIASLIEIRVLSPSKMVLMIYNATESLDE
jgi:hypothetical protein